MRIGVVANPMAGSHRGGLVMRRTVESLKSHGHQVEAVLTARRGEAIGRSEELADEGMDALISIGGDGTLNEVVNGVYRSRNGEHVAVGMVPAGRGRDTARTLGSLPQAHLPDLATFAPRLVDLGLVHNAVGETRAFINGAGFGFDAAVASRAINYRRLPGTIPYFIATTVVLPRFQSFHVEVQTQTAIHDLDALAVMASNCQYVGGGMKVAPDADPGDGLLDFLVMKSMTKPDFAANFLRVYRGTHVTHPAILTFRATAARFTLDRHLLTHVDGEIERETTTAIDIMPAALHWIGPGR